MFPIIVKRKPQDVSNPEDDITYIVGRNGVFIERRSPVFTSVLPATEIPMLESVEIGATYALPPLPPALVAKIIFFFRVIWFRMRSEAILLIRYNPTRQTFRLDAPPQRVLSGHCSYEHTSVVPGFFNIGTVHSHGSLGAFHSGTDEKDEMYFDGIHLTVGRVDEPRVEIVASLAVGTHRFPQEVVNVLGGVRYEEAMVLKPIDIEDTDPPVVATKNNAFNDLMRLMVPWFLARNTSVSPRRHASGRKKKQTFPAYTRAEHAGFVLDIPSETDQEEYVPDESWFAAVTKDEPAIAKYVPPAISGFPFVPLAQTHQELSQEIWWQGDGAMLPDVDGFIVSHERSLLVSSASNETKVTPIEDKAVLPPAEEIKSMGGVEIEIAHFEFEDKETVLWRWRFPLFVRMTLGDVLNNLANYRLNFSLDHCEISAMFRDQKTIIRLFDDKQGVCLNSDHVFEDGDKIKILTLKQKKHMMPIDAIGVYCGQYAWPFHGLRYRLINQLALNLIQSGFITSDRCKMYTEYDETDGYSHVLISNNVCSIVFLDPIELTIVEPLSSEGSLDTGEGVVVGNGDDHQEDECV